MRREDMFSAMKLLKYLKVAVRAAGREYLVDRYKSVARSIKVSQYLSLDASKVKGQYVLSTEKGVFLIDNGRALHVFPYRTYGIALHNDDFYLSSVRGEHNSIFKARLPTPLEQLVPGTRISFQEIYYLKAHTTERIHQICIHQNQLVITKPSANAIVFLNLTTGEEEFEIRPFVDSFGIPISGDHNHINSVFSCGEVLLFGAYRAGDGSLIGAYHNGKITAYHAGNIGLHGAYISGQDLYYGDTFGSEGEGKGYLIINNKRFDESHFQSGDGFCVRGVCQSREELLIGHSHKGPRAKRFEGPAFLLRCNKDHVVPFAAIYDIMRMDGTYFDKPPHVTSWDEVNRLLQDILGDPVYECRIQGESFHTPPN
jgi:hypothetical protein